MNVRILKSLFVFAMAFAARATLGDVGEFDSNGVKIHYVTEGEGVAVVLIHGWMGDSSMWGRDEFGRTKLDTKDAKGFRVVALDCRGHGKSGKPHDVAAYGPEMGEDVVRLMDHLKIDKAHLIGYSSGSFVAGYVAAHHPERVRSVVYAAQAPILKDPPATEPNKPEAGAGQVVSPPGGGGTKETAAASGDADEVEIFAKAVEEGRDLVEYVKAVMPADRPKPNDLQARNIAAVMFYRKDLKALAAAGRGFKHLAVDGEQLKASNAPTLFVHGSKESERLQSRVANVRAQLGVGEFKLIEGGDHMTTLAKPEFGATLMAFLRAN